MLSQQMLGRGTMPSPGKSDCLILDVVGVSTRHAVHTAARLLDCDASALRRHTVTATLADRAREVQARTDAIQGTLRSTSVDLFTCRALRWVQTRQGAWVLSLGAQHGTLRLRPDGAAMLLGETLPLAYAQGLAEDFARRQGVARLVDAEASWRQQPATEKQTALMQKLGVSVRPELTKGEATDLLAPVLGDSG
jgi:hypothetical protein